MVSFDEILAGGDLRSIGESNAVVASIHNQKDFDTLLSYLSHTDRIIVMRVIDAVEKVTRNKPQYIRKHKDKIFELCRTAENIELRWHLASLLPRLDLRGSEHCKAWDILLDWTIDKENSRIVRVNSIQGLFELSRRKSTLQASFLNIINELKRGYPIH